MTGAFLILAALSLLGGLIAGLGLACVLAPFRGQTGKLPRKSFVSIYAATLLATLPALAVFLGLIAYEQPPTLLLFFATGGATALPLLIAPARLPRGSAPIAAFLALGAISALATLFATAPRFLEARDGLHRICSTATETLGDARRCREHVDTNWSLPGDLPQT